ncbi:hypothetical protein CR152_01640 [Massilia violaceinigra]|uniref:Uncharacterized protein n=1 Tax=Massilia violaceinigra TaxID=2045208 RepID=A0A2D2DED8_9BURK|nr:hypothetical protein [Massilia violaceinigra]ATQ73351.1 hypothetical protein CR152_01640 [Massilia violaceinigra]
MIDLYDSASPAVASAPPHAVRSHLRAAIWFAGVILPVIALAALFIGLRWEGIVLSLTLTVYIVFIASVPLANALLIHAVDSEWLELSRPLALLHGFATGISAIFAILFLPLTPVAVLGLVVFGLGLLLLAPLLALIATLAVRRVLAGRLLHSGGAALPSAWPGVLLALAIVGAMELPSVVTRVGMRMASDEAHATSTNGIRVLRYLGNEKIMRRICAGEGGFPPDLTSIVLTTRGATSAEEARASYYRLTGTQCSAVPAPSGRSAHASDGAGRYAGQETGR